MPNIGFLLYPGVTLMDFAGATQVFAISGYDVYWIGPQNSQPIRTTENVEVVTNANFTSAPTLEILFVPGGNARGVEMAMFDADYQIFIRDCASRGGWVGAVCVGAFIVAAGRHLDHCQATTYWSQIPNLQLLSSPFDIQVAAGFPRYVIDGSRRRFTGGGVSSSVDLALALVAKLNGENEAQRAQLNIQYAPSPPIHAGDPNEATPTLVQGVTNSQSGFIQGIHQAVLHLISS